MGSYTTLPDDVSEVDIILAGGGTAACIIAGRLLDRDPSLSLLIVEAGRDNRGVDTIEKPGLFLAHIMPESQTVKCYTCNKSEKLAGREAVIQTGNVLGGGSSVNFMMYTRAQRDDLDRINMPGWNAKELLPYMKKIETYHGPGDKAVHGTDGPVHVSYGTHESKIATPEFLRALSTLGHPTVTDVNDLDTCNATSKWLKTVCPNGVRQDTARCYLHSKMDNPKYPNLHVLTETKVNRVLLDGDNRAVGIEFAPNSAIHPDPSGNAPGGSHALPKRQVKARRQVIVSSGAIGTPLVLQRSGIGNPSILQRAGVPCKVDLPGVGREYQDHHLIIYPYSTSLPAEETIDDVLRDAKPLLANKDTRLGWNGIDMSSKLRPSEEEVAQLSPAFQKRWAADFRDVPNRPIMLIGLLNCFLGDPSTVPKDSYYVSVANYTAYPYSRGHIYITGPDADDKPDFDAGFLSDEGDVDVAKHVWAYKKGRDAMRRTNMYRGEVADGHPRFPEGSAAACGDSKPSDAPFKYTKEDDKAIEQYVREHVNSTWHSIATARMAPRDDYGVVDKDLNVYGTKGLKLADMSIFPVNIGANTNNTAMLIGEKAADILIKELLN